MEKTFRYDDQTAGRIDGYVENLEGQYAFKDRFILGYRLDSGSFGPNGFRIYENHNYPNKFILEVNGFDGESIEAIFDLLLLGRESLIWQSFKVRAVKVCGRIEVCLTASFQWRRVLTETKRSEMVRDFLAIENSKRWMDHERAEERFNTAPLIVDALERVLARQAKIASKIRAFASRHSFFVRIPFIRNFLVEILDLTTPE